MRTQERYPARWPTNRQALLVCTALAGAVIVGVSGALLGLSASIWEWATALGGAGAGAVFWAAEVLF
jgi:sterol desaturase/sphingolipid hydroxylase (fatty acid hydroxylase superfamily)